MGRELGKLMPRAEYRFTEYPSEPVKGQPTGLENIENGASFNVPIQQDQTDEWAVSGDVRYEKNNTSAILPDSGRPLPNTLWDIMVGGSYRHRFENGWIGALSLGFGSASDRPFAGPDELVGRVVAFGLLPRGENDAWIFSLIYASDQDLFDVNIPFPGIAYLYHPSKRFNAVIGVPVSAVEYKPVEKLTLEAQYFPLRHVRSRITYEMFRPLRFFGGFDWDNERYYPVDRDKAKDQLFYYEKRLMGGVRFDLRHIGFQVRGGYAFDRFFFVGDSFSDRDQDRIDVGSGPFVNGGVMVRF